jgi:hypothetical protein
MSNATSSNGANVEQEPVEVVPASVPSSVEPLKQNIPSAAKSIVSIEQKVFGGEVAFGQSRVIRRCDFGIGNWLTVWITIE